MHLGFSSMNTLFDPPPPVLARHLEERGFESLWYGEHSHIPCAQKTPYPGGGELPAPYKHMMDPYVSLMAAAAATTKLRLGTGILNLYWSFGAPTGPLNSDFAIAGFTGLDNLTSFDASDYSIPMVVVGLVCLVYGNTIAWRYTGGY